MYKEEIIKGDTKRYQRADKIVIDNEYGKIPSITFHNTSITVYPTGETKVDREGEFTVFFDNPAEEIEKLNPLTDEIVETITASEFYAIVYSVYMKKIKEKNGEK